MHQRVEICNHDHRSASISWSKYPFSVNNASLKKIHLRSWKLYTDHNCKRSLLWGHRRYHDQHMPEWSMDIIKVLLAYMLDTVLLQIIPPWYQVRKLETCQALWGRWRRWRQRKRSSGGRWLAWAFCDLGSWYWLW